MKILISNRSISLLLIAFVIFISGCVNTAHYKPPKSTPTVQEEKVEIQDSEFDKNITFTGITDYSVVGLGYSLIRSWLNKDTGNVYHQLYITQSYRAETWRNWIQAYADDTSNLEVESINSNIEWCHPKECYYKETIGIDISSINLQDKINTGFRIKVSAKSGVSMIIQVTPKQIKLQLEAIASKKSLEKTSNAINSGNSSTMITVTGSTVGCKEIKDLANISNYLVKKNIKGMLKYALENNCKPISASAKATVEASYPTDRTLNAIKIRIIGDSTPLWTYKNFTDYSE